MHPTSIAPGRSSAPPLLPLALCLLALLAGGAQALMLPLDDAALATGADEIVRGEITSVSSRWSADHAQITTTATVRVNGRARGAGPATLELTALGGTVDGITEWVEDEPLFANGTDAVIFVAHGARGNRVHGGAQGLVPVAQGRVRAAGRTRGGVSADAYLEYLGALAEGRAAAPPAPAPAPRAAAGATPVIASVSPQTASAGTETWLTIRGTGFGNRSSRDSNADVGFVQGYDGSAVTPIWASGYPAFGSGPDHISAWTDTEITVRVPTGLTDRGFWMSAASGYLWVLTEENAASANHPFTVTFAYGGARWYAPASFHVNPAGWDADEVAAITNATAPWNAAIPDASFRFDYAGASSAPRRGVDGRNMVLMGDPADFEGRTALATAYVWDWGSGRVLEADIAFNPVYAWTADPAGPGQYVGTVALHEFGHWLSLRDLYGWVPGYPSDAGEVMFGYVGRRSMALHPDDVAGARWIYPEAGLLPAPGAAPSPFPGPRAVGARIQAEDFDAGGEGVAYHDTEPANLGGAHRPGEGVDVETGGGITNVGWVRAGEWLGYTVNATAPQSVAVRLRASNPDAAGKAILVSTDNGYPVSITVPPTGSFGTYALALSGPFWLREGATQIRLEVAEAGRMNLDWLEVLPAAPPAGSPVTKVPTVPTSEVTTPPTPNQTPALAIGAPGRYALDRDLSADVDGVVITSSDVVLDGMGHAVTCTDPGSTWGAGVSVQRPFPDAPIGNVTVRNLMVRGWNSGIDLLGADGVLIEDVTAEGNSGWGLRATDCEETEVLSSACSNNALFGVALYTPGAGISVTDCSVTGNGQAGIAVVGARDAGSPPLIVGNDISSNTGTGIMVEQPSDDGGGSRAGTTIRDGTISRNGDHGVMVIRCDALVDGNRVEENGGTGVSVSHGGAVRVTRNRVEGNARGLGASEGDSLPALEAWDNVLNNTVNSDLAAGGSYQLNATRSAGPNVAGGPFTGGNLWAAPDGTGFSETHPDADGDGFCDEPFELLPGVVDRLPLAAWTGLAAVPPGTALPTDTDGDRVFDDVNGNGRADFADLVLYFNQMAWIAANEPVGLFDCNGNGRIDFADVVWLFNRL